MKKILTILGSCAIISSGTDATVISCAKNTNSINIDQNNNIDYSLILDNWYNRLSEKQKNDAQTIFAKAIYKVNEKYFVNINKLKETKLFSKNVLVFYEMQNINGVSTNLLTLQNENVMNESLKINGWKIWAKWHWYWFGYWKLCFNHKLCDDYLNWSDSATSFLDILADQLGEFGGSIASVASAALNIISLVFGYDRGNGVYIGFLVLVPVGWGAL